MTTAASELIALRTHLATHLHPTDAAALAWPVIASLAGPGLDRGWGGAELAAAAMLGVYSGGIEDPAAYIAANLRDLARDNPPREVTPTPPPIADVLTDMNGRHTPADHQAWINRIRAQHEQRKREARA